MSSSNVIEVVQGRVEKVKDEIESADRYIQGVVRKQEKRREKLAGLERALETVGRLVARRDELRAELKDLPRSFDLETKMSEADSEGNKEELAKLRGLKGRRDEVSAEIDLITGRLNKAELGWTNF